MPKPPRACDAVAQGNAAGAALDDYAARLEALFCEMAPRLPEVDPSLLLQVLDATLRPIGSGSGRRFLLRAGADGRYGP